MRETSASEPSMKHRKAFDDVETGVFTLLRKKKEKKAWRISYLPAMRRPVYGRRDSHSGSLTELGNLAGDAKGKGTSGETARPKVPMRWPGADRFVLARKRGNARGAK